MNYYELLQVSPIASDEVIRASYRALAQRCHPDKCPGDPNAEDRFKRINEAYRVLSDPVLRRQYDDATLLNAAASNGSASKSQEAGRSSATDQSQKTYSQSTAFRESNAENRAAARKKMAWGAGWLLLGLLITGVGYMAAAERGGGRYLVTFGLIFYGAFKLLGGTFQYWLAREGSGGINLDIRWLRKLADRKMLIGAALIIVMATYFYNSRELNGNYSIEHPRNVQANSSGLAWHGYSRDPARSEKSNQPHSEDSVASSSVATKHLQIEPRSAHRDVENYVQVPDSSKPIVKRKFVYDEVSVRQQTKSVISDLTASNMWGGVGLGGEISKYCPPQQTLIGTTADGSAVAVYRCLVFLRIGYQIGGKYQKIHGVPLGGLSNDELNQVVERVFEGVESAFRLEFEQDFIPADRLAFWRRLAAHVGEYLYSYEKFSVPLQVVDTSAEAIRSKLREIELECGSRCLSLEFYAQESNACASWVENVKRNSGVSIAGRQQSVERCVIVEILGSNLKRYLSDYLAGTTWPATGWGERVGNQFYFSTVIEAEEQLAYVRRVADQIGEVGPLAKILSNRSGIIGPSAKSS